MKPCEHCFRACSGIVANDTHQEDNVFTSDPGAALYLDDVLLPLPQGELLDMLDVERVEILRGPQGTLYGRNTSAGAVKYVTRPPSDRRGGDFEFVGGNYWRRDFKGTLNFPLMRQRILTRISIGSFNRNGFEKNTFTGRDTDSKNSLVGRGSFLVRPNEHLDIGLKADGVRDRPTIHVGSLLRPQTTALNYPDLLAGKLVTFPVPTDRFIVTADTEDSIKIDTWGTAIRLDWRPAASFAVSSLSSYRSLTNAAQTDFDSTAAEAANVFIRQTHKQASEEIQVIRLSTTRWKATGGIFFLYTNDHEFDGTDGSAKGFSTDATYYQRTRSAAGYGQVSGRVTSRFSMTLGLRYTFDTKEFGREAWQYRATNTPPDYNLFGGCGTGPTGTPPSCFPGSNGTNITLLVGQSAHWNAWTPRFGLEYQLAASLMAFASLARGYKSGGFNGRASLLANPDDARPYNPEYVWTYETGARLTSPNQRVTGGLTYFYNDYTDLQLQTFVAPRNDAIYQSLLTNAGKAVTQGFELDLRARPLSRFVLFASSGYTNAKFVRFINRDVDVSRQRSLPQAPRWTTHGGGAYTMPVKRSGFTLQLGGDVAYVGPRFLTVSNLRDLRQGGYTVLNAFAALQSPEGRWSLQAGLKNLMDRRYMVAGLDGSNPPFGIVTGFWGDPRTGSISIKLRF